MQKYILLFLLLMVTIAWSQNSFKAIVKDHDTDQPLVGANAVLAGTTIGGSADQNGLIIIDNIQDGEQQITFSYIGYEAKTVNYIFPLNQKSAEEIFLEHHEEETESVIISATRSSRTIADNPTRVEAIAGEELDEKGNMKPGDIRMLLNESTGIQTQQTSATSYNSSIRIQGLDGKYTQIQKDGYPLYSGFSGGLSLLQIVPLDLKQVEVIKGASSTLYGGGAIAGLVNLVSKVPTEKRELSFLLNGTSALGLDASSFYSQKFDKIGTTIFLSYNLGSPYDPADIGLTAIPEFRRYTINPKLFYYLNENTTLNVGFNTTIEDRTGGDIDYIEGNADSLHSYFEKNNTTRFSAQSGLDYKISEKSKLSFKNSYSYYDRSVKIPDFEFSGEQLSSFSEAAFNHFGPKFEWIIGLNLWTDKFSQRKFGTSQPVDYEHITLGAFVQNTWTATDKISLESGLRFDHQNEYGDFVLPRIALLYKSSSNLTFRLGGGMGYKTPTVFTEDAERLQFKNVLPIDVSETKAEESIGTNFDINFRTLLSDEVTFSINTLLFYTQVKDPIELMSAISGLNEFQQIDGYIDTKGLETNIKLTYDHYKLFIGYTHADVNKDNNGKTSSFPLVAKHRLNNVLMYEVHDELRIGLEAYYFSPQKLNDGRTGKEYWIMGLMTEKMWEGFSLFLNFENFLDTRQTKFETIYSGSKTNPVFNDIYAPVDGFVINGGIKIKL
ncbi:MAG: TonB-dependent receptor [Calditrichaeota bacterium]|nr:MAG: TonB-dependent receptor [Calditrichota bacterium]MBL1205214.1 TonB-dependent receptor [Calditrichota bacterium]NOG45044.1 TonB-dependent receptor [Calditrichota bacterium]